jgi:hypothetical protein
VKILSVSLTSSALVVMLAGVCLGDESKPSSVLNVKDNAKITRGNVAPYIKKENQKWGRIEEGVCGEFRTFEDCVDCCVVLGKAETVHVVSDCSKIDFNKKPPPGKVWPKKELCAPQGYDAVLAQFDFDSCAARCKGRR